MRTLFVKLKSDQIVEAKWGRFFRMIFILQLSDRYSKNLLPSNFRSTHYVSGVLRLSFSQIWNRYSVFVGSNFVWNLKATFFRMLSIIYIARTFFLHYPKLLFENSVLLTKFATSTLFLNGPWHHSSINAGGTWNLGSLSDKCEIKGSRQRA